jgi:hypothetical protein
MTVVAVSFVIRQDLLGLKSSLTAYHYCEVEIDELLAAAEKLSA